MNFDEMTLEEVEKYVNEQKEKRINSLGEEGLKWKKVYGIITEEEFEKGLLEIRKNNPKPKDWWHTPCNKIKGMYL